MKLDRKIVIVIIILLATLLANRENFWGYSSKVSTANGDDCTIRNGIMVCKEKGIFPAWFYPSYYYRPYGYGYGYGYPYYGYGYGYPYYYGGYGRRGGRRFGGRRFGGRRGGGRRGGRRSRFGPVTSGTTTTTMPTTTTTAAPTTTTTPAPTTTTTPST